MTLDVRKVFEGRVEMERDREGEGIHQRSPKSYGYPHQRIVLVFKQEPTIFLRIPDIPLKMSSNFKPVSKCIHT